MCPNKFGWSQLRGQSCKSYVNNNKFNIRHVSVKQVCHRSKLIVKPNTSFPLDKLQKVDWHFRLDYHSGLCLCLCICIFVAFRRQGRCHIRLDYHSGATLHYITSSVTSVAPLLYINSPHPTSNLVTTQPGLYFRFYKARLLIWWRLKVIFNKKKRELEQEIVLCTRKTLPEAQRTQGIESITQIIPHGK